ncbi:hypothetical protein [Aneurinibacillus aneurinilyticus]|jgi:hypothetical protein|uniref:DUF1700 domain-containing protein n=2 Tax=Aneurinibacillus aneurinilyticus TaxID=1391 RepID=A0A848CUT3_ANEAE|nr:hypothetical protein [Aneurinibacillus aneurinilyticus]ERI05453.1 hypothetical protein HMPREF0083_05670 [Aneurinibacillus aneurinilyticus ATCC 12856]MCI1694258.1 hypothetical protein [Aneurinibacillus aneurinilyticus]MED0673196.1 hypothetical protein [Aneurinibacillus aneurinilyticus]MED0707792.1 hypothetical protein [Aneurinibacillus aneurinilyticus]MED0723321.1 hypothetical protein [Aneurinibacillus aneurinilyticus]
MIDTKEEFLCVLRAHLPKQVDADTVIEEFACHIDEACMARLADTGDESGEEALQYVLHQLGSPVAIAARYSGMSSFSFRRCYMFLICANSLFFLTGIGLLYGKEGSSGTGEYIIWQAATQYKEWVLLLYASFWMFAGLYLGRRHGFRIYKRIRAIMWKPLLLNYAFMLGVLFQIVPWQWFSGLLTVPFVFVCIVATLSFPRIAALGCRWGALHTKLE